MMNGTRAEYCVYNKTTGKILCTSEVFEFAYGIMNVIDEEDIIITTNREGAKDKGFNPKYAVIRRDASMIYCKCGDFETALDIVEGFWYSGCRLTIKEIGENAE